MSEKDKMRQVEEDPSYFDLNQESPEISEPIEVEGM